MLRGRRPADGGCKKERNESRNPSNPLRSSADLRDEHDENSSPE